MDGAGYGVVVSPISLPFSSSDNGDFAGVYFQLRFSCSTGNRGSGITYSWGRERIKPPGCSFGPADPYRSQGIARSGLPSVVPRSRRRAGNPAG